MAAKKKAPAKSGGTIIDPRLKRLFVWAFGPGLPIVLAVVMVAAFAGGWYFLWSRFSGAVLSSEEYLVTPERVQISRPPGWIRSDIRAEVFQDASLDGPLSIMAPDLAERIAGAFSAHPWVARVVEVRKLARARVEVDLVYRKPVCMVAQGAGRLLPVDVEGVLLPADDFSPVEAVRYPRIEQIDSVPVGLPGTRWGDIRVTGGAQIAAAIGPAWHDLCLDRIVPSQVRGIGYTDGPTFELYTLGGSRFLWGRAPETDVPGEIPAAEKVARLVNYKQEYGTLDGIDGPQQLDIRSLRSMGTPPQTAGRPEHVPR